jgi:hypothetical protein
MDLSKINSTKLDRIFHILKSQISTGLYNYITRSKEYINVTDIDIIPDIRDLEFIHHNDMTRLGEADTHILIKRSILRSYISMHEDIHAILTESGGLFDDSERDVIVLQVHWYNTANLRVVINENYPVHRDDVNHYLTSNKIPITLNGLSRIEIYKMRKDYPYAWYTEDIDHKWLVKASRAFEATFKKGTGDRMSINPKYINGSLKSGDWDKDRIDEDASLYNKYITVFRKTPPIPNPIVLFRGSNIKTPNVGDEIKDHGISTNSYLLYAAEYLCDNGCMFVISYPAKHKFMIPLEYWDNYMELVSFPGEVLLVDEVTKEGDKTIVFCHFIRYDSHKDYKGEVIVGDSITTDDFDDWYTKEDKDNSIQGRFETRVPPIQINYGTQVSYNGSIDVIFDLLNKRGARYKPDTINDHTLINYGDVVLPLGEFISWAYKYSLPEGAVLPWTMDSSEVESDIPLRLKEDTRVIFDGGETTLSYILTSFYIMGLDSIGGKYDPSTSPFSNRDVVIKDDTLVSLEISFGDLVDLTTK